MAHSVQRKSSRSAIPSPAIELRSSSPSSSGARIGPSEALPRHLPEAATAVYAAARHKSRLWTCSMDYPLDEQSGLRCPVSTCVRAGPITHICSAGAFGTVDAAAAARVRAGERSSFDRSALSAVSVHYVDDVRRPGIGGSARLGHATSIPSQRHSVTRRDVAPRTDAPINGRPFWKK